jgi:hypothetical protein
VTGNKTTTIEMGGPNLLWIAHHSKSDLSVILYVLKIQNYLQNIDI